MADKQPSLIPQEVARRLKSLFIDSGRREFGVGQAPQRRGLVFTFCLLSAAGLWFLFSVQETYTQFFDFPVTLENVPPEMALTGLPPSTVRVQVEGRGAQLIRLYYNPPTIELDAGSGPIDLASAVAEVTGSVRMESVTPGQLDLVTEPRIARKIPIRSQVDLVEETGYHTVGVFQIDPDSITVTGAQSIIDNLHYWPTEITLLNRVRSLVRIPLALSDTLAGLVEKDAAETIYQVDVQQFTDRTREIEVRVIDAPPGQLITIVPATTLVTFQVPLLQFDRASTAPDFYAYVSYAEIEADTTGKVYPRVHTPEGLFIRSSRIGRRSFEYYLNLPERQ